MFWDIIESREAMIVGLLWLIPLLIVGLTWANKDEEIELEEEA